MGLPQQVFVSKYLINLPSEADLQKLLWKKRKKDNNYIAIFKVTFHFLYKIFKFRFRNIYFEICKSKPVNLVSL